MMMKPIAAAIKLETIKFRKSFLLFAKSGARITKGYVIIKNITVKSTKGMRSSNCIELTINWSGIPQNRTIRYKMNQGKNTRIYIEILSHIVGSSSEDSGIEINVLKLISGKRFLNFSFSYPITNATQLIIKTGEISHSPLAEFA